MKLAVVIPSVGRPRTLSLALQAIQENGQDVSEVIVVCQEQDEETQDTARLKGAKVVIVDQPGLAWAMRQGALATECDVVAFTDDDARIRPGWSQRLLSHYRSDDLGTNVGGVGGRDAIEGENGEQTSRENVKVGLVGRFGRVHGGHHLATGGHRSVHHLKGVNCSFRREAFTRLDFQNFINGSGAQTRNEFVASLGVRQLGFTLVFDPELIVDHYPAPRAAGEERSGSAAKFYESAFNERLGFRLYHRKLSFVNAIYLLLIGYRHAPGLLRLAQGAAFLDIWNVWMATFRAQKLDLKKFHARIPYLNDNENFI